MVDYVRWLRDAMDRAGISQAELARGLRVHPSKVTRWLKGERAFKGDDFDRLSEFLQIPLPGRPHPGPREEAGAPSRVGYAIHAKAIADEAAWRDSAMTAQNLAKFPPRAATLHPLFDPRDQYYVPIYNGLAAEDPEISAEYVICVPIGKLDRRVRPGDWVHAKLRKRKLHMDVVRKVVTKDGQLVLSPLKPGPGLEDIRLADADLEGFVLTYQQDRHV